MDEQQKQQLEDATRAETLRIIAEADRALLATDREWQARLWTENASPLQLIVDRFRRKPRGGAPS